MKRLHKTYYNYIALFLSCFMLLAGMCFFYDETDSFLTCMQSYKCSFTLKSVDATREDVDVCDPCTFEKQEQLSSLSSNHMDKKITVKEYGAYFLEDIVTLYRSAHTYQNISSFLPKCSGHGVILNFIHSQDGEK